MTCRGHCDRDATGQCRHGCGENVVVVTFTCPQCRHSWDGAHLQPGAWWSTMTPDDLAKQVFCLHCKSEPPMEWSTPDRNPQSVPQSECGEQLNLFTS